MRQGLSLFCFILLCACDLSSQVTTFENIALRQHRNQQKRLFATRETKLIFDDTARMLVLEDEKHTRVEIPYDAVDEAVSETTTHMRAGAPAQVLTFVEIPIGAIVGSRISGTHVNSHWLYLRYRASGAETSLLMELPESSSDKIVNKATAAFDSRMSVPAFIEKAASIKLSDLKNVDSGQIVTLDKKNHPLPEMKADKAIVLVACPTLPAYRAGSGKEFRLYANDEIIAINMLGTYSFAYLDPGRYRLVSQQDNASGFEMELEAGHEYYFLQNTFGGLGAAQTVLSRNSPELVSYLVDGSYFSDWKIKQKRTKPH